MLYCGGCLFKKRRGGPVVPNGVPNPSTVPPFAVGGCLFHRGECGRGFINFVLHNSVSNSRPN